MPGRAPAAALVADAAEAVLSRWRRVPPVQSPLAPSALAAGLRAAAGAAWRDRAAARVVALLGERYQPKAVLLTDGGTAALTAALLALPTGQRGRPVALPAYACYDVATAAEGAGVPLLLYDVDPETLAPDLDQLRETLRRGAAAVVAAHWYGYPVDLAEVNRLAAEAGAVVIEDAAQVAGGTVGGHPAGTQASLAVLSFGRGKGLTGGSGGALLANDAVGARVLRRAEALLGTARRGWGDLLAVAAALLLARPSLYPVPAAAPFLRLGQTVYRDPRRPRPPSAASCAVVAATWALAEREVEVRRRNAERLLVALRRQRALETIRPSGNARPGYLRLPVLAPAGVRRLLGESGAMRLGVMPGYPRALCDVGRVRPRCLNGDAAFPGSRLLAARLCTLPTHGGVRARDLVGLERWIDAVGGPR
jgi:hypothetical protein